MLFEIEINGETIPIQAVKRNGKVYYRLAPYTIDYPTKKQQEVRDRVAMGGFISFDSNLSTVNDNVKNQFTDWIYAHKTPRSRALYEYLKIAYGNDADAVIEHMTHKPAVASYPSMVREKIPVPKKKALAIGELNGIY